MDGIQKEAKASPRHTRAAILTNTATTVMTNMTMMKRRMIMKTMSILSQKIPRVTEGDATQKTRWGEETWGGWNNSSVWMLPVFKYVSPVCILCDRVNTVNEYNFMHWWGVSSCLQKSNFQMGREAGAEGVDQGEDVGCSTRTRSWRANPGEDVDEVEEETRAWTKWCQ